MNKTIQAVKTVNFRLYFKVIIRQNETQYFTYTAYIQSKRAKTQRQTHRKREIICKTVELYLCDRNTFIFTMKQVLIQLVG